MTKSERIKKILPALKSLTSPCALCGHHCGVDRLQNERGKCRTALENADNAVTTSHNLHFGEEPPLVGKGGSGTVFFTHCNLSCVFCQNYQISQLGIGQETTTHELTQIFLKLQNQGAQNINLVTPTHFMFPIAKALAAAYDNGLNLPLVYNTNGFDNIDLLRLLDGIVDIYLPDMKYMDPEIAAKYSSAQAYPEVAKTALREMYRQAGPVQMQGVAAKKGVIIRHLILPNSLAGTYDFLLWLKDEEMMDLTIGLMSQYSPQFRAHEFPDLDSRISHTEYRKLAQYALELGFENLLTQGLDSTDLFLPDFQKPKPFED